MSLMELRIPDIGGSSDVNVAEVYVNVGDTIKIDDNLVMLETDKATNGRLHTRAQCIRRALVSYQCRDVYVPSRTRSETSLSR